MSLFYVDKFNSYSIICKKRTYAEFVSSTPSVRGQRTHSNAETPYRMFTSKKAFPFDLRRGKRFFQIKANVKKNKKNTLKVKNNKNKSSKKKKK